MSIEKPECIWANGMRGLISVKDGRKRNKKETSVVQAADVSL